MSSFENLHHFQYKPCREQNVPQRTPNLIWQNCMMQPNYGVPFNQHPMQFNNRQNWGAQNNWRGIPQKPKRKKESNYIDYCDICDRGFSNETAKSQHYQQHVYCNEPGCKFQAHPKIVAIHKRNQHGRNAIPKLDTPEEIEQWRQERKRNFPTAANIAKKKQMLMERQKNGNVLQNRRFDKMRGNNRRGHKKGFNRNQKCQQNYATEENSLDLSGSSEKVFKSKNLLESQSVSDLTDENGDDMSDSEPQPLNVKKNITSALGSLMQDYASDEEDEDGDTNKSESNKMQMSSIENSEDKSNSCQPSPTSNISNDKVNTDSARQNNKSESKIQQCSQKHERTFQEKTNPRNSNLKSTTRPTLLEMLLAPEIRRERNLILQCVRYVVKNNFFDENS